MNSPNIFQWKEIWLVSIEKTISLIRFEIEQVDNLLKSYDLLLKKCSLSEPDLIELTAAASVLHSFYNGVEKIFITIAKRVDEHIPEGHQWHRDLLKQMNETTETRDTNIISEETLLKLLEYMGFRHFYRHAYSFMLSWSEMKSMVLNMDHVWFLVKDEMEKFIFKLKK